MDNSEGALMKKALLALMLILSTGVIAYGEEYTGTIHFKITGVNVEKGGIVEIGLYNIEKQFPLSGKEFKGVQLKADTSVLEGDFWDLPEGVYAIAVYQDQNMDKKLSTNLFGAPTEGYGFSNNKYGMFGPPDFAIVSFPVTQGVIVSKVINLEQ